MKTRAAQSIDYQEKIGYYLHQNLMERLNRRFNDSPLHLAINLAIDSTLASDGPARQMFIPHIVDHGDVRHAEKDATQDVIADESVASQSQCGGAIFATEASSMEETAFGVHPLHQIDPFAAKMARLRPALLGQVQDGFGSEGFGLVVGLAKFGRLFRELLGHGRDFIATSMARV